MKNELSNNDTISTSKNMFKHKAKSKDLSIQDQIVAWTTSRLFSNQMKITGIENRCLMVSIKVSNMERYENFKLQVYRKFLYAVRDLKVDIRSDQISMLVAGDVEGTRKFNVDRSTMINPYEPHYHVIIVFSSSLWDKLQRRFYYLMRSYAYHLADLNETKFEREDINKNQYRQYFWWTIYDDQSRKKLSKYEYRFPLGKLVSYSIKADLISNKLHLTKCQPSVFPHDLLLDEKAIKRSDSIFDTLVKRQLCDQNKGTFL
ncbi:hypothetical protein [Roseicyclus mahoneyensis]|jgi:hypothetical protein|uniref:Replication protein n=1 Tax=Roseicyclus mahoneyensis TaxID=164332 RepID=A0A316GHW1_9RHOB|nr:hypothetical protein [Roseicyclus mahoneyensis]PWK60551.1 hypothetical protein C7455_104188 [Roseicyclus mahoneyensis]